MSATQHNNEYSQGVAKKASYVKRAFRVKVDTHAVWIKYIASQAFQKYFMLKLMGYTQSYCNQCDGTQIFTQCQSY
jgi:hypothetical protein